MQSVLGYIERSRQGYARMLVDDALACCGYQGHTESEAVQRLRDRLAAYIMVAVQHFDLEEPQASAAPLQDVAGSPPAVAGEPPPEMPAEVSDETVMEGEEILEKRTPPPVRKRK